MKRQSTEKRREQIKKAVLDIIMKQGLHNLSIRNLAKRVGITEGAIFKHFKSKKEIIRSIMDDVQKDLMTDLRYISRSESSAEEKLFEFLYCHIKYLVRNKGISILLFSEAAHLNYRELKKRFRQIIFEQESLLNEIIISGIKEGKWNKKIRTDDFAILYRSIPIAFNFELVFSEHDEAVRDFCKRMNELLVKILKK